MCKNYCVGYHGLRLEGNSYPALIKKIWLNLTRGYIFKIFKGGIQKKTGMIAGEKFKKTIK
jgi:hypothetical protein